MNPAKLTREQTKKLVYGLKSLNEGQRELVLETLERLSGEANEIWPKELQRALHELRVGFKISEIDAKAITAAVFP